MADSTAAQSRAERGLNEVATNYVKLCLAVGQHDPNFVDAYYGPPVWQEEAKRNSRPLSELALEADALMVRLGDMPMAEVEQLGKIWVLRREFLGKQLRAARGRLDMLLGKRLSFDLQVELLYDSALVTQPKTHYQKLRASLEGLLPGPGPLVERLEQFEKKYVVPAEKRDAVLQAAIAECRKRTRQHLVLPATESFTIEYVSGKPWGAYNWYKGNARSLIQINTDLPFRLNDAIVYAAHEGYPGHHVYNLLLEQQLARKRGWVEFQVYPLFSPESLVAEGTAEYGIELVLPPKALADFEREVLFPLAGFDPAEAARYAEVQALLKQVRAGATEDARRLIDGEMTEVEFVRRLREDALYSEDRAKKLLSFVKAYGAYAICYDVGRELVRQHVVAHTQNQGSSSWTVFGELLSTPAVPSRLTK